ncbi:MAG: bifunctional oligoribonuclease/PAP phosphatase NrnA [Candidatus Omnitrophota bacterium]
MGRTGKIKKAVKSILNAKSVAIAGHIAPDGDSIGSLLSLGAGLESLGKKVYMISSDGVPKKYKTLPGAEKIVKKLTEKVDIGITVDCSSRDMMGEAYDDFRKAETIIAIDHHRIRKPFGDIEFIDPKAAAVGEQIHDLLRLLKAEITRDIAQNILTSLIVETNSFRLPNARARTFKMCAELIKKGADFYKLVEMVFWSHPREVAVLSGICLARCKFLKKGRLVWSIIKQSDFKRVKGKDEDVDGAADQMRAIKDVDIVVLFREQSKEKLRVSLRAKKNINIAKLAESYGGGGHADVAGCGISNDSKTIKDLLSKASGMLNEQTNPV